MECSAARAYCPELCINLDALARNYRTIKGLSVAETGAVVKADAYGAGIEAAVTRLVDEGCKTFFTFRAAYCFADFSNSADSESIETAFRFLLFFLERGASIEPDCCPPRLFVF